MDNNDLRVHVHTLTLTSCTSNIANTSTSTSTSISNCNCNCTGDLVDPHTHTRPDHLLPDRLSRLEIVPVSSPGPASSPSLIPTPLSCNEDNPFRRRSASRHQHQHPHQHQQPHCTSRRLYHRQKQTLKKMLREREREPARTARHPADVSELVSDCSRLTISETGDEVNLQHRNTQQQSQQDSTSSSASGSCSQQALNPPPPCDVTVAELASYFETMVYIPKKMSTMAEMMYI